MPSKCSTQDRGSCHPQDETGAVAAGSECWSPGDLSNLLLSLCPCHPYPHWHQWCTNPFWTSLTIGSWSLQTQPRTFGYPTLRAVDPKAALGTVFVSHWRHVGRMWGMGFSTKNWGKIHTAPSLAAQPSCLRERPVTYRMTIPPPPAQPFHHPRLGLRAPGALTSLSPCPSLWQASFYASMGHLS